MARAFLDLFRLELVEGDWVHDLDDPPDHRDTRSMPILVNKNALGEVMLG